ncbi:hypothetical protein BB561_005415 [Smittium simulii]|uniref:Uncharacterized protein n=1 Tax=Smittium simulii TaxID=133385 RepID=A0A2T9YAJ0_9FUNG|nr:hypothetical protein BB561_005415 [Smittium simulii]
MIFNTLAFFAAFGFYGAIAIDCLNEGAKRCVESNGKSARFITCSNGKEVESMCKPGETCYGNGETGPMCINAPAFRKRQKLMKRDSAFGGYEPLINNFNDGLYGDGNSFGGFISNMRSMMFVDKNSLTDVSNSVSSGINDNKAKIASNAKDIGKLSQTANGRQEMISGAKRFSRSLNQNRADYSYLVTDVAVNSKTNKQSRDGLSRLMTNSFTTSAGGATGNSAISGQETQQALSNLNVALNTFYPATLGKAFTGTFTPSNIAGNVASLSSGNANGTAQIFDSLVSNTKGGTQYLAPFTAAAVDLTDSTANFATPVRLNNVFRKYQPKGISDSNTVNFINGAANAAANSRGKFRSSLDNSLISYTKTVDNNQCGCGNSDSYSSMMMIASILAMSQMGGASGSYKKEYSSELDSHINNITNLKSDIFG